MKKKKIVIVGATSAMATHCARLWTQAPIDLVLIGRDKARLARLAQDIEARSPASNIQTMVTSFTDPIAIQQTVESVTHQGQVDIVLISHGSLGDQALSHNDLMHCSRPYYLLRRLRKLCN